MFLQETLTDADGLRRQFDQLVVVDEFDCGLERQADRRSRAPNLQALREEAWRHPNAFSRFGASGSVR